MMPNQTWAKFVAVVGVTLILAFGAKADTIISTTLVGTPNPVEVGGLVTFVAEIMLSSPSGNQISITGVAGTFNFGDGLTQQVNDHGPFMGAFAAESASHSYPAPGVYDVSFSGNATYNITCANPPCVDPSLPFEVHFSETVVGVPELGTLSLFATGLTSVIFARKRFGKPPRNVRVDSIN